MQLPVWKKEGDNRKNIKYERWANKSSQILYSRKQNQDDVAHKENIARSLQSYKNAPQIIWKLNGLQNNKNNGRNDRAEVHVVVNHRFL